MTHQLTWLERRGALREAAARGKTSTKHKPTSTGYKADT
jgi:hypothetical protein